MILLLQGPIPLADAAAALIGSDVAIHKRPQAQITVERRLYDIGSILSSVGLIEKTYLGKRCVSLPPASILITERPMDVAVHPWHLLSR